MIRRVLVAVAVAAMVFSMDAVHAGGTTPAGRFGGGVPQFVRIKNIGSAPVLVNAANGGLVGAAGGKLLSQNAVAQFNLRNGPGIAMAANPAAVLGLAPVIGSALAYNFPNSKFVYLQATLNGNVPTIKFAPPGTIF